MLDFSARYKSILPDLHSTKSLMCFSDYSGEEEEADFSVYSFLLIGEKKLTEWDKQRQQLRNKILPDDRRISYKNYRDKLSQNYISEYLKIANNLDGYLITISISKNITSLFDNEPPIDLTNPNFEHFNDWTNHTLEKTFRIIHLLGFFVSGFSRKYQNLIWITDNDKIAANKNRLKQLTNLFSYIATEYLKHTLGHMRIGTTSVDDGSRLIEDLCSIPDLAAGAYSDQLKNTEAHFSDENGKIFWMYSPEFKQKTNDLTWWLTTSNKMLSKLYFRIEETEKRQHNVSFYHFYDRD